MFDAESLRGYLALERRSVTEVVTGLTIIAVAGATFYNLGFFAPIEWSLISLLTVQDLLIAAAISLLPMIVAAALALLVAKLIRRAPENPKRSVWLGLATVATTGVGLLLFLEGPYPSIALFLICAYLFLAGVAATANAFLNQALLPAIWLAFSLAYIPLATGAAESLSGAANRYGTISEVQTDQELIRGKVLRITSSYLLLFDGTSVVTLPMNRVRSVTRRYHSSPEEDFLPRLRSRARALLPG